MKQNAIALPGVPVEVVGTGEVVYTDVDGRYVLELPPGTHEIKVDASTAIRRGRSTIDRLSRADHRRRTSG